MAVIVYSLRASRTRQVNVNQCTGCQACPDLEQFARVRRHCHGNYIAYRYINFFSQRSKLFSFERSFPLTQTLIAVFKGPILIRRGGSGKGRTEKVKTGEEGKGLGRGRLPPSPIGNSGSGNGEGNGREKGKDGRLGWGVRATDT